jgi:acetyl esterase
MPVDAEIQPILDLVNAVEATPPTADQVPELRDAFALLCAAFGPGPAHVEVEGIGVPNGASPLGLRVYRDPDAPTSPRPGALVWFHGGGWVIGDLDTHDALCRELCVATGATVISVDYRLAPEHTYPCAHDDAQCAVDWISAHAAELGIDPSRLAVGGDSAGGHLAAVTARRRRDAGDSALAAQVLVYPVTDLASPDEQHPSRLENATGYLLSAETMQFFCDTYVPDERRRGEPDASPLATDDVAGLPPALVITAQYDPLRDEGARYAQRLESAGVPVELSVHEGATHMFLQMTSIEASRRAIGQIADALRTAGVA